MRYIVVDFEFNQPFDFPEGKKEVLNIKCPYEIIGIGGVLLDEACKPIDEFSSLVQPQVYTRLHPFVEKITGITTEALANEPFFPDVFEQFLAFIGKEATIFCTWGKDDIKELYKNVLFHKQNHKTLSRKFVNVQKLAGDALHHPNHIGLKTAAEAFFLPTTLPFHDALSDAIYTAKIFALLDKKNMFIQTFHLNELVDQIDAKMAAINSKQLYAFCESKGRKKLNDKEKRLMMEVYQAGRAKRFDIPQKNEVPL